MIKRYSGLQNFPLQDRITTLDPIYSRGTQTSTRINYLPPAQICAPFQPHEDCNKSPNTQGGESLDWNYGWSSCCSGFCPSKRKCAKPDPKQCDIGRDVLGRDPLVEIKWDGNAPNYRCTYDLHRINTKDQINKFTSKNPLSAGGENKVMYDKIMTAFCEVPSHICPIDPKTKKTMTQCSRLKSLDDEGRRCRIWALTQPINVIDTMIDEYCLQNPDSPDCRCQNRFADPIYDAAKTGHSIPDGCWYKPCSTSIYLQKSNIEDGKKHCPINTCQVIYNLHKNNNVVIQDNTNSIICDFQGKPPVPVKPDTRPKPDTDPLVPVSVSVVNIAEFIILVGIVFTVLVFFMVQD